MLYRLLPLLTPKLVLTEEQTEALKHLVTTQCQKYMSSLELKSDVYDKICDFLGEANIAGLCLVGGIPVSALVMCNENMELVPRKKWPSSIMKGLWVSPTAAKEANLIPVAINVYPDESFLFCPRHRPTGFAVLDAMSLQAQGCYMVPVSITLWFSLSIFLPLLFSLHAVPHSC